MAAYHQFYKKLQQNAVKLFPSLNSIDPISWEYLVSPLELRLPAAVLKNAREAVRALYHLSRKNEYQRQLSPLPGISNHAGNYHSVLMAYDFHTNESGDCFLVEVNTNASGFLIASLMEMTHKETAVENYEPLAKLKASFANELKLWGKASGKPSVAISDEDIPHQKMYGEFLMYRDLFMQMGWDAELCEGRDFRIDKDRLLNAAGKKVDLVYNRLTDFYFEESEYASLKQAYVEDLACVSPNPREYWLLGDKERLIQFGSAEFMNQAQAREEEKSAIAKVIIPTFDKSNFGSEEEIWSQRKQLFFKPKRSHGGKSVYRGESVSRKVFERLMQEDILIQRYLPAQRMPVDDPRSVLENWKFDLRCFAYEDEIQLIAARIYQGQVTNFSSSMGGFTLVRI
jgi:hypothetical protein